LLFNGLTLGKSLSNNTKSYENQNRKEVYMIFKIFRRLILCIIYMFLAYVFARLATIFFGMPVIPCDDDGAKLCSALTLGRISECQCAAFITSYALFWGALFALLAVLCALACITKRIPKKPTPNTERITTMTGTESESWFHKYNGKENNPLSDDYVVAGISSVQIGGQLCDVIEPVAPSARIETNSGEDLDCIIFRDGHATKFTGFLGIEQDLTATEVANKFPQYYPSAMDWFNNNPRP
jgi:hypothetical protein